MFAILFPNIDPIAINLGIISIRWYVAISLFCTPIIRDRLNEKFNKGAENQSFLVETISGIDTVKSMAVEPRWVQKWI